jgi:hypothetical protein
MDNVQAREREHLAFGRVIDWEKEAVLGTIFFGPAKNRHFPSLPVGNVDELLSEGFIDPESSHNESPPARTLVEWARYVQSEYRPHQFDVGLIGYMTSPERSDTRVRLEGISIRSVGPIPDELQHDVASRFDPDLLVVDDFQIQVWWD